MTDRRYTYGLKQPIVVSIIASLIAVAVALAVS